jgi:hypothetical protein
MAATDGAYIKTRVRFLGGAFLQKIFYQILRLRRASSRDEVVTKLEESLLSFIERTIIIYPILDTLVITFWYFRQSSHADVLQQKVVCLPINFFPPKSSANSYSQYASSFISIESSNSD